MVEVVNYSEEKTIEKLQKFVNGIASSPSVAVKCLTSFNLLRTERIKNIIA